MSGIEACFHIDWPGFTLDVDLTLPKRGVTALFVEASNPLLACSNPNGRLDEALASLPLLVSIRACPLITVPPEVTRQLKPCLAGCLPAALAACSHSSTVGSR